MNELFSTPQNQGTGLVVLLIDAANDFKSLNCDAMLLVFYGLDKSTFFLTPIGDGRYLC